MLTLEADEDEPLYLQLDRVEGFLPLAGNLRRGKTPLPLVVRGVGWLLIVGRYLR